MTERRAQRVDELVTRAARDRPDHVALLEPGAGQRRLTWGQLDREVDAVARGLVAEGLVAGYRVALVLPNRIETVVAHLAAQRAGLVTVPVNPRGTVAELVRLLADCGARAVLADAATLPTVRAAATGLREKPAAPDEQVRRTSADPRVVCVDAPAEPGETGYDDLRRAGTTVGGPAPPADPERLAVLLYTSGASARPRAAMLSHRALLANVEQVASVEPPMLTADDVVLGLLPLSHVYGLGGVLGQVLRRAATLVLVDGFDADDTLRVVEQEQVSVLPVAPPVFAAWRGREDLRTRLAGVRLVLSGSAPLAPEAGRAFTEATGHPVHQGYGLTEAAPVVTTTLRHERPKPGSVGAALPGVELRLVDARGEAPEPGDGGQIAVRGANLFHGWWPDAQDGPDAEGWYATGDVGYLDADGDLFLVDRLGELVVVSGFNVYPVEVEEVLEELDAVGAAAVIGTDDPHTGEAVVAYVRPAAGAPQDASAAADLVALVHEHAATRLAGFKRPTEVHVVDALPYTVTGKVAKGRLRAGRRSDAGLLR